MVVPASATVGPSMDPGGNCLPREGGRQEVTAETCANGDQLENLSEVKARRFTMVVDTIYHIVLLASVTMENLIPSWVLNSWPS